MEKVAWIDTKKIPLDADVLLHFCTTETYKSSRSFNMLTDLNLSGKKVVPEADLNNDHQQDVEKYNSRVCSWFIYALTEEIRKLREDESIEIYQLLIRVNRKVAMFSGTILDEQTEEVINVNTGQAAEIKSTLLKELYLTKRKRSAKNSTKQSV